MADLTDRAKDLALTMMFAGVTIGLTRSGKEITDTGYARQSLNPTEPKGMKRGVRSVSNAEEIRFGPWKVDAAGAIIGWFVNGDKGVMASGEFERQREPMKGDELVIHPGELVLGLK